MPLIDVSSSLVRERARRGLPIEELVGAPVASYIAAHGLYRTASPTGDVGETGRTAASGDEAAARVSGGGRRVSPTAQILASVSWRKGWPGLPWRRRRTTCSSSTCAALVGYTDFFLICSGNTDRQVKAIHDAIHEGAKRELGILPRWVEGAGRAQWVLMDYLDVVVHIFTPATREFYRLEQLWGEAPARAVEEERADAAP